MTNGAYDRDGPISVIDTATNNVTATVELDVGHYSGFEYSYVAIVPDGTKAYITIDNSNYVPVIDTATNIVLTNVTVGNNPAGIAVSPDGKKVYVVSESGSSNQSGTVYVIDTATNTVTATVKVGQYPRGVAVTPDGTKVYVVNWGSVYWNVSDIGTVSVIDTATNTVTATVNVGNHPWGVAVGPAIKPVTNGSLVQVEGYSEVYLIKDGTKHHFTSPEALLWNGHNFSDVTNVTSEALQSYLDGQDISISQAIIDKYNVLGKEPIFGAPDGKGELKGENDSAGVYCSYVNFKNGAIECFANGSNVGKAYAIFYPVLTKWASMGYGKSVLGYPIDNMSEEQTSKFGTKFRYQNFANGTESGALEYNLSSGNVFAIHGAIFAKWGALGYANSNVGLVNSDEKVADISPQGTIGKYSEFENGCIHWISNKIDENVGHLQRGESFITYGDLNKMYDEMGGTGSALGFPMVPLQK